MYRSELAINLFLLWNRFHVFVACVSFKNKPPSDLDKREMRDDINICFMLSTVCLSSSFSLNSVGTPFFSCLLKRAAPLALLRKNWQKALYNAKNVHSSDVVVGWCRIRTASVVLVAICSHLGSIMYSRWSIAIEKEKQVFSFNFISALCVSC